MGFCAASHLDLVVEKLEAISKQDFVHKSKGFFSFGKVSTTDIMALCFKYTHKNVYFFVSFSVALIPFLLLLLLYAG